MLDDRKLMVLKAIVTDYVSSREPVGSKALVERHGLGVSSATVRNDMAVLEEEGYIAQPHTSAGRIPTDKGYRLFVDKLAAIKPLSAAERRAISTFMMGTLDVDDLVLRTVRLLAQLTQQVAIVQYPVARHTAIRHLDLVSLAPERILVILIYADGRVDQQLLEVLVTEEQLGQACNQLRAAVVGQLPTAAAARVAALVEEASPRRSQFLLRAAAAVLEQLGSQPVSQVAVAGVPNLARYGASLAGDLRPLLEALEEQVVLLRLLSEADDDRDVTVRIGQENTAEGFQATSLIASGYGAFDEMAASLGVVGPTRMDYPATISSVRAVARYVSRFLAEG